MAAILDIHAVRRKLAALPVERFAAGQTLLGTGSSTGKLFVLEKGGVETVKDGLSLGTVTEPGAVFGEIAALLDRPHTADVRTLAASTFHVAPRSLVQTDAAVALYVATIMARRIEAANRSLIAVRGSLPPEARGGGILARIAAQLRYDGTEGAAPGYSVTPGALLAAVSKLPIRTYQPGERVLAAGTRTGKLYVLEDGAVEVQAAGVAVGKVTVRGALLGELALLLDRTHGADVRALETSAIRIADAEAFLNDNPAAALHVAVVMARRINAANEALIEARRQLDSEPSGPIGRALARIGSALRMGSAPS
jgi:CRP/FNR family transcriptional regulator, cyclic AMP receptor protein